MTISLSFNFNSINFFVKYIIIIIVTSLHDVMHSYAIIDNIINLFNEMKFIHLYLFNYVNIDGN